MTELPDHLRWATENLQMQWVHDHPRMFAYTYGMANHGLPELIVMGRSFHISPVILMEYATLFANGTVLKAGDIEKDLFTLPTKMGKVCKQILISYVAKTARESGAQRPVLIENDMLQIIWPDRAGIFPDEPGFSKEFDGAQYNLAVPDGAWG